MEIITKKLREEFKVKELDAGTAAKMKVKPMNFEISHYEIEGFGHFVIMRGKALMGLMKMDTVIFTPLTKDAPLFSYDRIKAMGNDTFIIELYNTLLDDSLAAGYEDLKSVEKSVESVPGHDLGKHWYDGLKLPASFSKKGKGCEALLDGAYESFFNGYLGHLSKAPDCDAEAKKKKSAEYVNGLFENGGPSTDAFVKGIGREAAEKLFKDVIFGIS